MGTASASRGMSSAAATATLGTPTLQSRATARPRNLPPQYPRTLRAGYTGRGEGGNKEARGEGVRRGEIEVVDLVAEDLSRRHRQRRLDGHLDPGRQAPAIVDEEDEGGQPCEQQQAQVLEIVGQ